MNDCQEDNHECQCGGNCNDENCKCENCKCVQDEWVDNPAECHEL